MSEWTRASRLWQLLLIGSATWAVTYARFILGPLQETVRLDLGLSDNQIAWLQGPTIAVPMALAAIPLGILVDRYCRVRLLCVFTIVNVASAFGTAMSSTLPQLFAARALAGLSMAAVLVAAYSMIGDLFGPAQRGRATTVLGIAEAGSPPAVFALGGVLFAAVGTGADGWRSALLWMSVPLMPIVLLLVFLREPARTDIVDKAPPLSQLWPKFWKLRGVVIPLLLARIMVWTAMGAVLVWTAPSFARRLHLAPERIGAIMAAVLLIGSIAGPILGGVLADFCQRNGGPRQTMGALAALTLLSVFTSFFAVAPSAGMASVLLAALLTVHCTVLTAAMALSTVIIPGELRGVFVAVSLTVATLFSDGVAPLVVSNLSGALGGSAAIGEALALVCGVTGILGALVFGMSPRAYPNLEADRVPEVSKFARQESG